jgi:CubicO group peptidase (beta-lactamase class C family)
MNTAIRIIRFTPLLLCMALCNTSGADNQSVPKSIPELQAAIETVLKETRTPGAGIAIVSRDQVEWVAGVGLADVATKKPVTAETLFRVGSVSKGFTALAALQLQEEGKLKLTDTVRQWVPEVPFTNPWEATDPVRLVHLMEHTSGFDDIHPRQYALNDPTPISLQDALAIDAVSRVARWRPGTRMAYSSSGPALLAAVVEKVSGERFEDYVREHIFNPLHMDTASFFYTPEVERRLTTMYGFDGVTPCPYRHISLRPAGALHASAKDMANYVRFYLQRGSLDGTQLLQAASIERMETTETLPAAKLGRIAWYGLFNSTSFDGAFVYHGHGGGVQMGLTDMAYLPDYGRGYAVMINSGNGGTLYRIAELVRHYLTRDLTLPALPPAAPVPAELQRYYAGFYQGISPREQFLYPLNRLLGIRRLDFTTNGLSVTFYELYREKFRQQWVPVTERLFREEHQSAARLALLPDAEEKTLIQFSGGTFQKVSALGVWGQRLASAMIFLLTLSSPLFALVWGLRKLFGKLHDAGPLSVRVMPLLSAVLLIALGKFLATGLREVYFGDYVTGLIALGVPSFLTIGIMLLTIAFPVSAAASLYVVYRERKAAMNLLAYWHSVLVAAAMAAVAIYKGYWCWIGLRLWAF